MDSVPAVDSDQLSTTRSASASQTMFGFTPEKVLEAAGKQAQMGRSLQKRESRP